MTENAITVKQGAVEIDGYRLRYRIEGARIGEARDKGAGLPVLVVGSSLYYSRVFSSELRRHLHMVFIDHRGFASFGPDTSTNEDFALHKLIDDIEFIRQHLALAKVVVIGHSGHGYLALEYAKRYPEQVLGTVMIATGPNHGDVCMAAAEQRWNESVDYRRKEIFARDMATLEQAIAADPQRSFIVFCLKMAAKSWYDPGFDAADLWRGIQVNMDMIDYVWGEVFRDIDITRGLQGFDCPVLLALGHYDFLVAPLSSWEPLRTEFQNLTVRVFERSGHTPQYEQPEQFERVLLEWLAAQVGNSNK